jgi:hypothetical protein
LISGKHFFILQSTKTELIINREITLRLPEEVFAEAATLAQVSGLAMDEFMAKLFQVIVKPAQTIPQNRTLVRRVFAFLSDDEILALANLKVETDKRTLFNQLLAMQKEQELSAGDSADLEALGQHYDKINLVKSYAMVEAVQRGLMAAPEQAIAN